MKNNSNTNAIPDLHTQALELAQNYRRCELALIEILERIEAGKTHLRMGYSSLFVYATQALELSEAVSYALIQVMRKSREIPELKTEIAAGTLTVSKAKRIVSVITPINKTEWVNKAKTMSKAVLEKEVANVTGEMPKTEFLKPIAEDRTRLRMDLSEDAASELRRAQVLLSTSKHRNMSLEETLSELTKFYLKHKDPLRKNVKKSSSPPKEKDPLKCFSFGDRNKRSELCPGTIVRRAIPSAIRTQVWKRDGGACQFRGLMGKKCQEVRGIEIHHARPWSMGGNHALENLTLRCRRHHHELHHAKK